MKERRNITMEDKEKETNYQQRAMPAIALTDPISTWMDLGHEQ
jgi:hypothetical protein